MQNRSIALLATGDELITGDILNTNTQHIAQLLTEYGYPVGIHIVTTDEQKQIEAALHYLEQTYQVIIMTGGLGPTTDDRTRFALASVLNQSLQADDASWEHIVQRLTHYHLPITENNRQQTLFPAGAIIFPNPHGTANGCKIATEKTIFYMLPGPPAECLPMFNSYVLHDLQQIFPPQRLYKRKWRLFNVSESAIAAKLEALLANTNVTTGYRIDYPYLEFKIIAPLGSDTAPWLKELEELIHPYLLDDDYQPASTLLKQRLQLLDKPLVILDHATGGYLQTLLIDRKNYHNLWFTLPSNANLPDYLAMIEITGLEHYWQEQDQLIQTSLTLTWQKGEDKQILNLTLPYRPGRVLKYAGEILAHQLLRLLNSGPTYNSPVE